MFLSRHKRLHGVRSGYDAFDFMAFMDGYLNEHPEIVSDQKQGWDIYWNPHQLEQEACPGSQNQAWWHEPISSPLPPPKNPGRA